MSQSRFLVGIVALACLWVGPVGLAVRLRGRFTPLRGTAARVGEGVVALALLLGGAELVGTFGALRIVPLLVVSAAMAAVASWRRPWRDRPTPEEPLAAPPAPRSVSVAAGIAASWVAFCWLSRVFFATSAGMLDYDTLYYHSPFAADFARTGSTLGLHFVAPTEIHQFFPDNGELLHALGIIAFGRDELSLVINLGWLVLALMAAWCLGRDRGLGPLCVTCAAVVVVLPLMLTTQVATSEDDIICVALLLAALALFRQAGTSRGTLAVAGTAAGLAIGTKVTMLAPIALLTLAVIWSVMKGPRAVRRSHQLIAWFAPLVFAGGYWYARNLAEAGSPVPPTRLPVFASPAGLNPEYRILAPDLFSASRWQRIFEPGLSSHMGGWWPALFCLAAALVGLVVIAASDAVERSIALVAIGAAVSYVLLPGSGWGLPHNPYLFAVNLRFLVPGLAACLVVGAQARVLRRPGSQIAITAVLLALLAEGYSNPAVHIVTGHSVVVAGLLAGGWLVYASRHRLSPGRVPRGATVVAGVLACVLVTAVADKATSRYLRHRYQTVGAPVNQAFLPPVWRWAQGLSGVSIGYAGGIQLVYPLFGAELKNVVSPVGEREAHGGLLAAVSCPQWRADLAEARYRYLLVAPYGGMHPPTAVLDWTSSIPDATVILRSGPATVFALPLDVTSAGCESAAT